MPALLYSMAPHSSGPLLLLCFCWPDTVPNTVTRIPNNTDKETSVTIVICFSYIFYSPPPLHFPPCWPSFFSASPFYSAVEFIQDFICLAFLPLSFSANPFVVFCAGEAVCIQQGPSPATYHQRSGGNTVPRIPQPAVHRER